MLRKRIPASYLLISFLAGIGLMFVYFRISREAPTTEILRSVPTVTKDNIIPNCYHLIRLGGFKYIKPILAVEPIESNKFSKLKNDLLTYIESEKKSGSLAYVSVFVRDLSDGEWVGIDPDHRYEPGSLLKVGVLVTYLRMSEKKPGLLNTDVVYHGRRGFVFPLEHYKSDTVVEGRHYKIRDLLKNMIVHSDNRATLFLENYMDTTQFKQEFVDLGMPEPHFQGGDYMVNAREYSSLLGALYNSSYLSHELSEYALSLLTESEFKNGLLKELPNVMVAHKFGESGDALTHQLHESGIVYLSSNPYLVTIMTQGTNWDQLSAVIGHISGTVYSDMVNNSNKFNSGME